MFCCYCKLEQNWMGGGNSKVVKNFRLYDFYFIICFVLSSFGSFLSLILLFYFLLDESEIFYSSALALKKTSYKLGTIKFMCFVLVYISLEIYLFLCCNYFFFCCWCWCCWLLTTYEENKKIIHLYVFIYDCHLAMLPDLYNKVIIFN